MPNPKGNPQNLQPIKSNREESLTERINLRITKTMKEELSTKDDPPEFCRRAIEEALDKDREK
ncbi:MAG: hypothetical protein V7K97_30160 [Nostoc sp.]|uniref:Uncharacterized protein n=1 Tax=Nostoc flagelliforme str. Sunitezuoqi TaxID=676037 RepID=E7DQ00_9NOSO|nr:hypothetical protein Nfla_6001 [Nostoc flagelliforme str. Sunitezuoqi]